MLRICAMDFMLTTACTNVQKQQKQQQYRRLADEDDELSEVQPGIYSVCLCFLSFFYTILCSNNNNHSLVGEKLLFFCLFVRAQFFGG